MRCAFYSAVLPLCTLRLSLSWSEHLSARSAASDSLGKTFERNGEAHNPQATFQGSEELKDGN